MSWGSILKTQTYISLLLYSPCPHGFSSFASYFIATNLESWLKAQESVIQSAQNVSTHITKIFAKPGSFRFNRGKLLMRARENSGIKPLKNFEAIIFILRIRNSHQWCKTRFHRLLD
ncbi:MAG: hypothetical protein Ct9H300mP28_17060 [Pseudomonadota bacterium]|nr:MAG: hypothetical protein Ct9H300mP28_17060 [Pseudomonadota bacterium]